MYLIMYSVLDNTDGYAAPTGVLYDGIVLVKRMEWCSVEDLPTKSGQKRCVKMARLNLSVLP